MLSCYSLGCFKTLFRWLTFYAIFLYHETWNKPSKYYFTRGMVRLFLLNYIVFLQEALKNKFIRSFIKSQLHIDVVKLTEKLQFFGKCGGWCGGSPLWPGNFWVTQISHCFLTQFLVSHLLDKELELNILHSLLITEAFWLVDLGLE